MISLRQTQLGGAQPRRIALPRPRDTDGISALLRHRAAPAMITAMLLSAGYAISVVLGEQPVLPPSSLGAILAFAYMLAMLPASPPAPLPKLRERSVTLLRIVSLLAISLELAYFGVPLLGSVPYNEFGWPVVHHLAAMHWLLVLFGTKRKNLDLSISLMIAATLFNRQMALFAILAYLTSTPLQLRRLVVPAAVTTILVFALGALRNQTLEVDTSGLEDTLGLPTSNSLFFTYLYLTGPVHSGLQLSSDIWDSQLGAYWNTVPEWALFATHLDMPPALSFALFYGLCALIAAQLRSARSWELRCLGTLIHIYSFFSFFSGVLLSTPIVASFLIVIAAGALYPARKRR